jgi:hypothetical protein
MAAMVPLVLSINDSRSAIFLLAVVAVKIGFIAAKTIPLCSTIMQRKKGGGEGVNRIKGRMELKKNLFRTLVSSRHCITSNHAQQYMVQLCVAFDARLALSPIHSPRMTHAAVGEGELAAYLIEEQQQVSIYAAASTRESAGILTVPQRRRKQMQRAVQMKLQQQQQQQLVGEIQQKQQQMQLQQQHIAPPLPLLHQRKAVPLSSSLNTTFNRPAAAPTESTSALDSSDLLQQP